MKRLVFAALAAVLVLTTAMARNNERTSIIIPGNAHIDVEKLKNKNSIDLNMDVSKLNLYEIRILRAAMAARQGECIMQSEIRRLFDRTTWYTAIAEKRYGWVFDQEGNQLEVDMPPISYSAREQAFLNKLDEAEKKLLAGNILPVANGGQMGPNLNNLANPMQLQEMPAELRTALETNGFAIVPTDNIQLFHIYENNDYHEFPNFVTTDIFLQAFHMYFDYMLRNMEENKMLEVMTGFSKTLYDAMQEKASSNNLNMKEAALRNAAYFAVAYSLFSGKPLLELPEPYKTMAQEEVDHVKNASNDYSNFLDYHKVMFAYDIYRPRGHYTRSEALSRYFQGMMWLQNAPFGSDKPVQLRAALLLASVVGSNQEFTSTYESIDEPISFLMGDADNLSILDIYEILESDGASIYNIMIDDKVLRRVGEKIEKKDDEKTRIRPKFEHSSHCKINFMPQRYTPDGEVLQEMVDYENLVTMRDAPKGLDVMAAMGISGAEKILIQELNEPQRWDKYTINLDRMKLRMGEIDWQSCVSNYWMLTLQALNETTDNMPYFMKNEQWNKKNLNAALASWAELKHDAILYAKQPMAAECGGGGLPEPYVVGYVEPNVAYWTKAIELIEKTSDVLQDYKMMTSEMAYVTNQLEEMAQFLLDVSNKELNGTPLSKEEFDNIKVIGSAFEYITLQITGAQAGASWDNEITCTDKNIAVIADVFTANGDNNPNKSVLYEAVGPAHEIYVVAEIGGYLYLTKGAVFSYREFQEDLATPRITDEEWQQQLQSQPNKGIPEWMKEVIVPLENKPLENEHYFYSTGC